MNLEQFRLIMFFIVLTAVLGICFLLIKPFFYILAWSIIITVIAYPLYKRLLKKINNPSLCSLLTCIVISIIVIIPLIFVFAYGIKEGIIAINYLHDSIKAFKLTTYTDLATIKPIKNIYILLDDYINFFNIDFKSRLVERVEQLSSFFVGQSINIAKHTVGGSIQLAIIMLTTYFLLKDIRKLVDMVKTFIPLDDNHTTILINKVGETIYTTVYVTIIVAITQGTLGGLAFWFLGLPSPILWGIVMAVFCLIPLLGHPFVWVPAAIFLVLKGIYWKAIVLTLWGLFVLGLIDNVIRTVLIGARTRLHPLIVFFSVLGGVFLIGPLGLLLGPVVIVIAFFLLEILKLKLVNNAKT